MRACLSLNVLMPLWKHTLAISYILEAILLQWTLFFPKLAVAAKDVLSKCSVAHGTLKHSEKQLEDYASSFEELAKGSGLSEKSQRKAWIDVEANRARLEEAVVAAMECLQAVENDFKKIKAAILWWSA